MNIGKLIDRIGCVITTGHRMKKYQTRVVNELHGKIEAYNKICLDCEYIEKIWVVKETTK